MEYVAIAAVGIVVGAVAWWQVTVRQRVFVIRIRDKVPFVAKGKVSQAFVIEFKDVLQRHGVGRGSIYGVRRGQTVLLSFSAGIPQGARQALRNVWALHGR
jgi:hypothetical protein